MTVTVNPGLATLFADEVGNSWPAGVTQQQFSATINGSTDQSVTWAVTGSSTNGTVDGNGLYTAPAVVPNPATVTVTATPAAEGSRGVGFCDGGGGESGGDIVDYGDGYGRGWDGAWGCGDADGAVERIYRRDAEGAEKTSGWGGARTYVCAFFLWCILLFSRRETSWSMRTPA